MSFFLVIKRSTIIFASSVFALFLTAAILFSTYAVRAANIKPDTGEFGDGEEYADEDKSYIKWLDFSFKSSSLERAYKYDLELAKSGTPAGFVELLALAAAKCWGNTGDEKAVNKALDAVSKLLRSGKTVAEIAEGYKQYPYFYEGYYSVLAEFVGDYEVRETGADGGGTAVRKYGLRAFSPIAKGYSFSHYDDFGNSRSYGYKRRHLGNDLMGSVGTPVIAVEGGTIEAIGWNQYGGWRVGIRSHDRKRYYYYAHLRKDHPYPVTLSEGAEVEAGDVIGYLGMTGYSSKENVNNIKVPHLHFGMQLIFDESQKDGINQIWIDVYGIVEFLQKNRMPVARNGKDMAPARDIGGLTD